MNNLIALKPIRDWKLNKSEITGEIMLKFNKQLATFALALIVTGGTIPAATAARKLTPAQRLCKVQNLPRGVKAGCTVLVTARSGVVIYSKPNFGSKKIGIIPHRHDVNVRVFNISRNWVKLSNHRGWIHYRNLQMAGD